LGLRRKTQIVTGLVLLGLLAALYAVTRRTLLVQFSPLEEEQTRQNLDRISNAINNELDLLDGSARDDSMWDEAYNYVQHPQPGWGENAFNDDSFGYLRLNGLAYLNAAGEPVYAREFDNETHQQKAVADPKSLNPILQQHPGTIHILLTDVLMPGINGREVARQVKGQHSETKTLYMSGYAYHTMLGRGVLEAAALFIQKPFTPSQLSRKVREVLDGVQSRATAVT
jgi:CheY-like chemotaxis protein